MELLTNNAAEIFRTYHSGNNNERVVYHSRVMKSIVSVNVQGNCEILFYDIISLQKLRTNYPEKHPSDRAY